MAFFMKGKFFWILIPVLAVLSWILYNQIEHEKDADDEVSFVGSAECIDCHEKFYELWAPSHHGLAMQNITSEFIRNNFGDMKSPEIEVDSTVFHVESSGDSLHFIENNDSGRRIYPAQYALGGKNVFYFLTPFEKGRLQVLPLAYDLNRKEWYNNPESALRGFTHEEDEVLPWKHIGFTFNTSCYGCHVSQLENNYDLASNRYHTTWKENGINCETCHGPSSEHVRVCLEAQEGETPEDLKIISTSTFNHDQHNASCGSCHAKMRPLTASFIPGEKFFDHFDLVTLEHQDYYPDGRDLGENYTYTTWLQSECVTQGNLDCIHCHTSSGRYRFAGDNPNQACMPCHQEQVADVEGHSHHEAGTEGSRCISCHMPMTEFARMHRSDHSMRPPSPMASEKFNSPNACIICHDDKTNDWTQKYLVEWNKNDHQKKIVSQGQLILQARNGDWSKLDKMLGNLDNGSFDIVYSTSMIRLLRDCPYDRKWPSIIRAMAHDSPLVRSAAATSLANLRSPESVDHLLKACADEYRLVRISAAQSLSSMPEQMLSGRNQTAYSSALNEYIQSITARPDDWASHATLGNFYFNRNEYNKAIKHFNISTRLFPENVGAYVNCGFAYTMKGDLANAEAQFRKALEEEPGNEGANLNYALLMGEMGRIREAEKAFKRVLEINPASATAAYNLSVIVSGENMDKALEYAQLAYEKDPENPKYGYTLGYYLFQAGRTGKAVSILEDLLIKHPSFGDSYMLLYEIYQQSGQLDKARALAGRAASNPDLHESYRMRFTQLQ